MIFRILLWVFILVFILRFIFRFVMPIFNMTRMAQDKMRQMQKQMDEMRNNVPPQNAPEIKEGEYIDYEEIK